jgi:hypothetical protein
VVGVAAVVITATSGQQAPWERMGGGQAARESELPYLFSKCPYPFFSYADMRKRVFDFLQVKGKNAQNLSHA